MLPQQTDIQALVSLIDSIYGLNGHVLDSQTVRLKDTITSPLLDPYHLLRFDRLGAQAYFTYLTFEFLQYRTSADADSAFALVEMLTQKGTLRTSDTEEEYARARRANYIFSKAGSTFLLLGDVILHHERRCNYSNEDVAKEDYLVSVLFEHFPNSRMMQGRCGWGRVMRRP